MSTGQVCPYCSDPDCKGNCPDSPNETLNSDTEYMAMVFNGSSVLHNTWSGMSLREYDPEDMKVLDMLKNSAKTMPIIPSALLSEAGVIIISMNLVKNFEDGGVSSFCLACPM